MAWIDEVALPFAPIVRIFLSPIIGNEVYVIDQETDFWKYNMATRAWTQLASPNFGSTPAGRKFLNKTLAISPDGTKLACCSEGEYYTGGAESDKRMGGGYRVEIYTIATNVWVASQRTDFLIGIYPAFTRALVWEDNDILWVWVTKGYATAQQINHNIFHGKCVRYASPGDTWTAFANSFVILGRHWNGRSYMGYASPAAIKADLSTVYLGATGGNSGGNLAADYRWQKYTIATDTYLLNAPSLSPVTDRFCYAYNRDKLWYFERGGTCQQGYVDTADDSQNDDQFIENPDRDVSYGAYCGIKDDLSRIIAHARAAAPELMSETTLGLPTVQTDPATEVS